MGTSARATPRKGGVEEPLRRCDAILNPDHKRYVHLDMMRIFAIFLVVGDHGDKRFGYHNVLFTPSWVLQLLWVICGMSWCLSPKSLCQTIPRVVTYLLIGVACNWSAEAIHGTDWKANPWNIVYQFWFMVGLGIYLTFTTPLRPLLRRRKPLRSDDQPLLLDSATPQEEEIEKEAPFTAEEQRSLRSFVGVVAGQVVFLAAAWAALGSVESHIIRNLFPAACWWASDLDDTIFFSQLIATAGTYAITFAGAKCLRSPRLAPWLAWVVLVYFYTCRMLVLPLFFNNYQAGVARFFIGLELFIIGLTSAFCGMRHALACKKFVAALWMFLFLGCAVIWNPDWNKRFDENPPSDMYTNARVISVEAVLVTMFLVAGDVMFDSKLWADQKFHMSWLGNYGLALFLLHKAIHILCTPPWNWVVLFGILPMPFIALTWRSQRQAARKARRPTDTEEEPQGQIPA